MVQAAIGAILLLGIYKLLGNDKEEEGQVKIDWWLSFCFILVPAFLIFFIGAGIAGAGLPSGLIFAAYILYFIIPLLALIFMLDFPIKEALKFSFWVPIAAIIAEIPFVLLMVGANA